MPAFVPVPGVTAITIDWLHDSVPCVNTFHYHTGTLTATQIKDLCTTVMNYIESNWLGDVANNAELVRVRGKGLWASDAPLSQVTPAATMHGTNATEAMPNNVSFAVKRETGLAGRHNRGRVYWITICDSHKASSNQIGAWAADSFIANLNGLLLAVTSASPGGPEVLVNRVTGATVNVTNYAVTDRFMDSQRRRLPGHNIHR